MATAARLRWLLISPTILAARGATMLTIGGVGSSLLDVGALKAFCYMT